MVIQKVSPPQPLGAGKWKVEIFANQLMFTNYDRLGQTTPFNKQILVRVREQPEISLPKSPVSWNLAAYRLGEARLEIYNVCDIEDKSCS